MVVSIFAYWYYMVIYFNIFVKNKVPAKCNEQTLFRKADLNMTEKLKQLAFIMIKLKQIGLEEAVAVVYINT